MVSFGLGDKFLRVREEVYLSVGARVRVGSTPSEEFRIVWPQAGWCFSPCPFSLFIIWLGGWKKGASG